MSSILCAQNVFTVVYATSEDDFVNVRERPSAKAKVLTQLWAMNHGLGSGVLLERKGAWTKVSVWGVTGWAYSKYVGTQTWYDGTGDRVLVAEAPETHLYGENYADEGPLPLFATVKRGTILADHFEESKDYYELRTGHDYLFIRKDEAVVKRR